MKMDKIVAEYRHRPNCLVISQSRLSSLEKPVLHHDKTHLDLLPLALHDGHVALAVIVIQPLTSSDWPGCLFFAAGIRRVRGRVVVQGLCLFAHQFGADRLD